MHHLCPSTRSSSNGRPSALYADVSSLTSMMAGTSLGQSVNSNVSAAENQIETSRRWMPFHALQSICQHKRDDSPPCIILFGWQCRHVSQHMTACFEAT